MPQEEIVEIIDDEFRVIGTSTREEAINRNLKIKAAIVIVRNSNGDYYAAQRSTDKKPYPLKWVFSAGGGVNADETFDVAVERELNEELGIMATPQYLFEFEFRNELTNYRARIYYLVWDGEVTPNPQEVRDGKWVNEKELVEMIKADLLPPGTAEYMKIYLEKYA